MFAKICTALSAAFFLVHAAAAQRVVVERVEGQDGFALETAEVADLSGLVWTGGDSFVAVSDHANTLVPLTLTIDPATGRIVRGEIGVPIPVPTDAGDFEGVKCMRQAHTAAQARACRPAK